MTPLERDLARLLGEQALRLGAHAARYEQDSTEMQGLRGHADAVVAPGDVEAVQSLVGWCAARGVPLVPRGGGTGFAGGAVPIQGGVVCSLEMLSSVSSFDPELWRIQTEAGVTTARLQMLARKSGVMFPPNPGAAEQSQVGGNLATNAGGPRSFKYGVTGAFVTGIEAVVRTGELIRLGGASRKDVAGYDLTHVLVGSEGTLGVIVSAWLRLVPAPEDVRVVVAGYAGQAEGVAALLRVPAAGLMPASLEFFDAACVEASRASFPGELSSDVRFLVISECDGTRAECERIAREVEEVLGPATVSMVVDGRAQLAQLERWRSGISFAVSARRGGKMSEDVAVPLDRLGEAIAATVEIGARHGLQACSWGHAGDGNLHATFMIDPDSPAEVASATKAAEELFATVHQVGGTVSGEHGLGWVKVAQFARQFGPVEADIQYRLKASFDPAGIFNPGKKLPAVRPGA